MLDWGYVLRLSGGMIGVIFDKEHLLSVLLSLRLLDFSLFVGGVGVFRSGGNYEISLIIVGLGACAGAVGLGILIGFARVRGGDFTSIRLGLSL